MVHRRTAIRALAAGGIFGISGCASVADRFTNGEGPESGETQTTSEQATTESGGTTGDSGDETTDDQSGGQDPEYSASEPTGYLPAVPIPSDPSEFDYPVMGNGDAEIVTLFANWKCPYTREFAVEHFADIAQRFLEQDAVAIQLRTLAYVDGEPHLGPDAPRAAWAGLAVWANHPDKFWEYFAALFQNQPPLSENWATLNQLGEFMRTVGVDNLDTISQEVRSGERDDLVRETTDEAEDLNIQAVPRLEYDGEVVAPNLDPEAARELLEKAAEEYQDD